MLQDTRIALFLLAELVAALQANDPDTFKRWLYGGIQDLGEPAVTELLLDWMTHSSPVWRGTGLLRGTWESASNQLRDANP